jgi:hypothetical protein
MNRLQKCRKILGGDHPTTFSSINNLAQVYGDLRRLDEVAKMNCRRGGRFLGKITQIHSSAWTMRPVRR